MEAAQLAGMPTRRQIARSLGLSPNTVKTHVSNLFEKLAVSRRTQAIGKARDDVHVTWAGRHRAHSPTPKYVYRRNISSEAG